jgi:hypothetical protein
MAYFDSLGLTRWVARACAILVVAAPLSAFGQTPQPQENPAEPATEPPFEGWRTESDAGATAEQKILLDTQPPIVLSPEQILLLGNINAYLNSLTNLQGRFVQTDHRNEETRGRFYVSRPGRVRFD